VTAALSISLWHAKLFSALNEDNMARGLIAAISFLGIWLPEVTKARADLITSNVEDANTSSNNFLSPFWFAQSFTTDNTSYTLTAITIDAVSFISSNGFTLSLYDDNSGVPGNPISVLTGPNNPTIGSTYVPTSTITLSPLTTYFAVAKAPVGYYGWFLASSTAETGPGTIGNNWYNTNSSGSSWTQLSNQVFQLRVEGTAVPEASPVLCFGLTCGGLLGTWTIKKWVVRSWHPARTS
jgi:hypothetical protein